MATCTDTERAFIDCFLANSRDGEKIGALRKKLKLEKLERDHPGFMAELLQARAADRFASSRYSNLYIKLCEMVGTSDADDVISLVKEG